jgi:hypothetical protein
MDDNIILSLQNEFKNEATNAPMLFKDLAKVEQYIAESYKTRSFIELIQNADDAKSKKFGIHIFDNFVIVGNDGRDFNYDDVKAICRSGSSNKIRGGSTIGYRGIGFKSVVNLAERVYVLSGNINFMYDKGLTQNMLNITDDVPLIRIPHIAKNIPHIEEISKMKKIYNYTTIFLFENIKENIIENELQQFDKSSVLFLNSVNEINLISQNENRKIVKSVENNVCKISENSKIEEWMIITGNNKYDKLAFKIENQKIVSANANESLIHSFTPTTESTGGYFKINGNFSTDPSRKNIDFDSMSEESFNNCTYMIANIIMEILEGNTNYIGFFKPFTEFNNAISSNKIRTKLLNQIKNNLCSINNMRLKPDIISIEDYKKMCVNNYIGISENVLIDYPEINSFFELIEIPYLSLDEMIQCIQDNCNLSEICLATILSKIIKKYRYDFSEKTVEKISNIKIFVSNGKKVDAKKLGQYSKLDENYKHVLNDNCELEDIKFSFKKLGIEYNTLDTLQAREISNTNGKTENEKLGLFSNLFKKREDVENINNVNINITQPNKEHNISKQFESKKFPNIQKWRSTEVNLAEYLRYFDFVDEVKDVSVSNLGYDLEIKLNNGEKMYVEVKSMISFSQPFKITNNEYTCAHNYGDKYYIALVINDDDFKVKFIQNPIANLHFEKKCEQWSWFCEEYKVNLLDINEIQ